MIRRALLAAVLLVSGASQASAVSQLALWVELDGSTSLWNTTDAPVSFDSYQISSQINELDPVGWKSINDYFTGGESATIIAALGVGGVSFGELVPISATNLAETNMTTFGTLAAGAKFSIGKPFQSLPLEEAQTFWKGPTNPSGGAMDVVYAPEPGTWLLATLAGLGLAAMRVRSKR
jgi:hypothetical protein